MIVTGAVQVYLQEPPIAKGVAIEGGGTEGEPGGGPLHAVDGPVKAPIVVFVPKRVSAEGVMLVKPPEVLLVTVITNVAVSPEKWQVPSAGYRPPVPVAAAQGVTLRHVRQPPPGVT